MDYTQIDEKKFADYFAERLDEILQHLGKRRPWLAEQTGISLSTINGWFARGTTPSLRDMMRILYVLGMSLEGFFSPLLDPSGLNARSAVRRELDQELSKLDDGQLLELLGATKMYAMLKYTNRIGSTISIRDFFALDDSSKIAYTHR